MRKTSSPNQNLQSMILELRKAASLENVNLWKRIAADLSMPSRQRRVVNISKINRFTNDNDIIVVPGKVLSAGDIDHKVQIAAFSFSKTAKDKISQANGTTVSILELVKSNPKGKGVRILG